jgi:hypothetical protein
LRAKDRKQLEALGGNGNTPRKRMGRCRLMKRARWAAQSCAQVVLIQKIEAIFSKNRWLRHNF